MEAEKTGPETEKDIVKEVSKRYSAMIHLFTRIFQKSTTKMIIAAEVSTSIVYGILMYFIRNEAIRSSLYFVCISSLFVPLILSPSIFKMAFPDNSFDPIAMTENKEYAALIIHAVNIKQFCDASYVSAFKNYNILAISGLSTAFFGSILILRSGHFSLIAHILIITVASVLLYRGRLIDPSGK